MNTFESGQAKQPANWEEAARQAYALIEKQGDLIQEQRDTLVRLDHSAETFLSELHGALKTTLELLEAGEVDLCRDAAEIALANLEERMRRARVLAAESQIGWTSDET